MGKLVLRLARNYKCKVTLNHLRFPEGGPGLVGIYGTRSKQRTRLQEGAYHTFAQLSKGNVLLATRTADTQPMMLTKLKVIPRFVVHCGEVMPKHLNGREVDNVTPPEVAPIIMPEVSTARYSADRAELRLEAMQGGWGAGKYDEDFDDIDALIALCTKRNIMLLLCLAGFAGVLAFFITGYL